MSSGVRRGGLREQTEGAVCGTPPLINPTSHWPFQEGAPHLGDAGLAIGNRLCGNGVAWRQFPPRQHSSIGKVPEKKRSAPCVTGRSGVRRPLRLEQTQAGKGSPVDAASTVRTIQARFNSRGHRKALLAPHRRGEFSIALQQSRAREWGRRGASCNGPSASAPIGSTTSRRARTRPDRYVLRSNIECETGAGSCLPGGVKRWNPRPRPSGRKR